jgi:hypothetical protein
VGVTAVLSLLLILILSVLLTRIGTVILVHTGLSREIARFQARSAFTGAGFTTSESEQILNHPLRRRVVSTLILLGNAGVVTAMASLLLAFIGESALPKAIQFLLMAVGVAGVWFIASSKTFDLWLSRLISRQLARHSSLNVIDVDSLLHLAEGYRISELAVADTDEWLANRSLAETRLRDEGVAILAIARADGSFVGNPTGHSRIEVGDTLICYGRAEVLAAVRKRRRGRHGDQVHEQLSQEERERLRDQEREEFRRRVASAHEERERKAEARRTAG